MRRVHLRPKKRKNLQDRLFRVKGFETVMPCRGEIPGTGEMLRRIASTGLRTCRRVPVSPGRVLPASPSSGGDRAAKNRARGSQEKQQTTAVPKRAVSPADSAGQRAGARRMGDGAASSVPRSAVEPCSRGAALGAHRRSPIPDIGSHPGCHRIRLGHDNRCASCRGGSGLWRRLRFPRSDCDDRPLCRDTC